MYLILEITLTKKFSIIVVGIFICLGPSASAEWPSKDVRSVCGRGPKPAVPTNWLATCERQIRGFGFDDNDKIFSGNSVTCSFQMKKQGFIDQLKIVQKSKNPEVDQLALSVIRKSLPFPKCKNTVGKIFYVDFDYPRLQMKTKLKTAAKQKSKVKKKIKSYGKGAYYSKSRTYTGDFGLDTYDSKLRRQFKKKQ